jgi:Mg-chelatase subunit ChlI
MLVLITTAFALMLMVTMDNGASSKRGVVAVVGMRAFAALDVRTTAKDVDDDEDETAARPTRRRHHHPRRHRQRRQRRHIAPRRASSCL